MSLNIKNEEAHRLAREIADLTGESMTSIVTEALREKLGRISGPDAAERMEAMLAIATETSPLLSGVDLDHGRLLYDEQGLPR